MRRRRQEHQRDLWRGLGHRHPRQHLLQGRSRSAWWRRPRRPSARSTSWSATPLRIPTTGRWRAFQRRPVPQDPRQQHPGQPLADPAHRARHDRRARTARSSSSLPSAACADRRSSAATTCRRRPTSSSPGTTRWNTAPHNVRVNCIAPGLIQTDFAKALVGQPGHPREAPPPARRSAASDSPTRSRAPRCSSPRRPVGFMTGSGHRDRRRRHHLRSCRAASVVVTP